MTNQSGEELELLRLQLEEARQEAETNLRQLEQVQGELEFYLLSSQKLDAELKRYRHLMQTTESLVGALLTKLEQSS